MLKPMRVWIVCRSRLLAFPIFFFFSRKKKLRKCTSSVVSPNAQKEKNRACFARVKVVPAAGVTGSAYALTAFAASTASG